MRLIDADALKEKKVYCPERHEKVVPVAEIDWMPPVEQPRWISVKDRMPPNADHPGAFCPRYLVMTDFGITIGWYNPDKGKWYGVGWWMYDTNRLEDVDFEKGDIPKRVILPVEAWMPLPEPPKEGEPQ